MGRFESAPSSDTAHTNTNRGGYQHAVYRGLGGQANILTPGQYSTIQSDLFRYSCGGCPHRTPMGRTMKEMTEEMAEGILRAAGWPAESGRDYPSLHSNWSDDVRLDMVRLGNHVVVMQDIPNPCDGGRTWQGWRCAGVFLSEEDAMRCIEDILADLDDARRLEADDLREAGLS